MKKTSLDIKSNNKETAIIKGARELGVEPDKVKVAATNGNIYTISLKEAPWQIDIEVRDDKMAAILRTIMPPLGSGKPVTAEDVERDLEALGVVFGIDRETICKIVAEATEARVSKKNIIIAKGTPPVAGKDGKIEIKVGRDAANKDPGARNIVRPGQIIAVRVPATKGIPGKNILDEEVIPKAGVDKEFTAGENVTISNEGTHFISKAYGMARTTWKDISVRNIVQVSPDEMWAEMPLFPLLSDNRPLTFEDIALILKNNGIKHGIRDASIKTALESGGSVENYRVAEATPAMDGEDAKLEFRFRLNGHNPEMVDAERQRGSIDPASVIKDTVQAGDVLVIKIPAVKPVDGRTVTGAVLKGAKPKDKRVTAGENITVLEDGLTYVVAEDVIAGYADFVRGRLWVEIPLSISEDGLSACLSVQPPSETGRELTLDHVKKILAGAGVVFGIDMNAAEQAIGSAKMKGIPIHDVRVAKGRGRENGKDAVIDLKIQLSKPAGTFIEGSDRVNFKEQRSIQNVRKGDVLATKTLPTSGKEGVNIFGIAIPSEPGKDKRLIPVGNVALSDDGLTWISEIDGMVTLKDKNKIGVFKTHEVSGDVDLKTGNLTMEGTLRIKGWIRSGFIVRASGEIHVGGGIEDALVEAGCGLYVQGGILGSNEGMIHSGGDLTAFFIENAKVDVEGNMFLCDTAMNSRISVGGVIEAIIGKGRLIGGIIEATKGIVANEIGSIAGVKTKVSIGTDLKLKKRMEEISKRLTDFGRQKAKMDMVLARYSKKGLSESLPKEILFKLNRLVHLRRKVVQMETRLGKDMKGLAGKMSLSAMGSEAITVNHIVYSGAVLVVRGCSLEVKEDIIGKVTFRLNREEQVIDQVR